MAGEIVLYTERLDEIGRRLEVLERAMERSSRQIAVHAEWHAECMVRILAQGEQIRGLEAKLRQAMTVIAALSDAFMERHDQLDRIAQFYLESISSTQASSR